MFDGVKFYLKTSEAPVYVGEEQVALIKSREDVELLGEPTLEKLRAMMVEIARNRMHCTSLHFDTRDPHCGMTKEPLIEVYYIHLDGRWWAEVNWKSANILSRFLTGFEEEAFFTEEERRRYRDARWS